MVWEAVVFSVSMTVKGQKLLMGVELTVLSVL